MCPSPTSAGARAALSCSRHAPCPRRSPIASPRGHLRSYSEGVWVRVGRAVQSGSLQRAIGSRPYRSRVRRRHHPPRHSGSRNPHRQGGEPDSRTSWANVGRQIPREDSAYAARSPTRARLRATELAEARPRCSRHRSAFRPPAGSGVGDDARGSHQSRRRCAPHVPGSPPSAGADTASSTSTRCPRRDAAEPSVPAANPRSRRSRPSPPVAPAAAPGRRSRARGAVGPVAPASPGGPGSRRRVPDGDRSPARRP